MLKIYKLDFEHYHQKWIDDVLSRWDGVTPLHTGQNSYELNPEDYTELVDAVANGRELFQIRGVWLPPGNKIKQHRHPKWEVAIYMPMRSSGTLRVHNPDRDILTEPGMCYEMEADRAHSVSENEDDEARVTLAMLFLPCS